MPYSYRTSGMPRRTVSCELTVVFDAQGETFDVFFMRRAFPPLSLSSRSGRSGWRIIAFSEERAPEHRSALAEAAELGSQ